MARLEDHIGKDKDGRSIMKRGGKVPTPTESLGKGKTPAGRGSASDIQSIKETGAHKIISKAKGGPPKPY